jgi:hypothetical protein
MDDLFNKEEVTAPSMEAAIAEATKPVLLVAQVNRVAECTRDTRGEADCAVKDCENCN